MTSDIARAFSEARERASAAVRAGGNGIEVARALSSDVDTIVVEAAGREVAKCNTPVAVFATGGHSRFGDTIFLLEPDLKNGPGGMRDLCVGRWAATARFGTCDPKELLAKGVMTGRLAQAFVNATEWLLRVRIAMHAAAGRRMDHLRFALQEAIAPVLCPDARDLGGVIRPAVHPAVEALMHQYHAHAKLIRNETERLLQRATAREDKRRKTKPVFMLAGGKSADPN